MERGKLKKAVALLTETNFDLEALMGLQVKILWNYYNKLKEAGFSDEQAFKLRKMAAPKYMEMELKKEKATLLVQC